MDVKPNLSAVRGMVEDAKPIVRAAAFLDPRPGEALDGIEPGSWTPDDLGLPPGCPVIPLGVQGDVNWFLDPIGQLVQYGKPYGQADTLNLFRGRHEFLKWAWPKYDKQLNVDGWKNEQAREVLVGAATAKGPWSAVEKVRGRGCWRDADGRIVMHCGDALVQARRTEPPGQIGEFVYPTRPPLPRPWPAALSYPLTVVEDIKRVLGSWAWSRPDVDPHLLLGWIGCAMLGPALEWRSNVYLTGDAGMGKSTLQSLVKGILGDWLIQTTNTTAAGIYQHVGQDGLAIAVDEFEGRDDNRTAKRVLELARQASSGGQGLRGGDRGTGSEFVIRSAFLFSSINTPPLEPQDLSRFALLKLQRLSASTPTLRLDVPNLRMAGRIILAQLMRQFHRYDETYEAFRSELADAGMDARGRDTFGTLLACADLIEHDGWDDERLRVATNSGDLVRWADLLHVSAMAEFEDRDANWLACLNRMLSVPVEAWRNGTRWTVGQVLADWFERPDEFQNDIKAVRQTLGQAGLGLKRVHKGEAMGGDWLAVPNANPILQHLFRDTKWFGEPGAGVWAGALRQSPRGEVHEVDDGMRVNGVKSRCTLIKLEALYGSGGLMAASDVPQSTSTSPDL